MLTLPSVLERTVRLYGQRTAIRDPERDYNWRDFADRVARAAGVLQRFGLRRGERFAIISRNSFRFSELNHAGYRMGAVPVPINYRLAPPEIHDTLKDADCRLIVIEDVFQDLMDMALSSWKGRVLWISSAATGDLEPQYEKLLSETEPLPVADCDEDDDAILIYTGGTTGQGKGVRLSHRNIVCNALQLSVVMGVGVDDVYLHSSPMFHSSDLKSTVITMMGGSHIYLADVSARSVLQSFERHKVTVASLVPTIIMRILEEESLDHYDLASLRLLSYGSSPMFGNWIQRAAQQFSCVAMHQCYGLTEASPILAVLDEHDHRHAIESGDFERLSSAGRPLVGVDLRILDATGQETPIGEVGEVVVRAPNVATGYHNRPEENAATFRDGWLYTGDVGRVDEDGYLYIVDRKKDIVITGGENVYTSEVEAVLSQHPQIQDVAVVGVPDEEFGEALCAVIVPVKDTSPRTDEIISFCRGKIGGFKIPRRIMLVDVLPRSAMGKVRKDDLRRMYGANPAQGRCGAAGM